MASQLTDAILFVIVTGGIALALTVNIAAIVGWLRRRRQ
jgi:hypothetical protein